MNKGVLERLYWACSDEEVGRLAQGLNLYELYERGGEAGRMGEYFSKQLYALDLSDEEKTLLESLSFSVATVHEKQGFMNGFRLGMKLAGELGEGV